MARLVGNPLEAVPDVAGEPVLELLSDGPTQNRGLQPRLGGRGIDVRIALGRIASGLELAVPRAGLMRGAPRVSNSRGDPLKLGGVQRPRVELESLC